MTGDRSGRQLSLATFVPGESWRLRDWAVTTWRATPELSIAMSIIEMAEEESEKRGGAKICSVHLKLGRLAGVVKEALLASYELACEGTELQGSRLVIDEVPVVVNCHKCLAPRTLDSVQWFICPVCGSPVSDVIQGRELEVVALELQESEVSQ